MIIKDVLLTLGVLITSTLVSMVSWNLHFQVATIVIIYMLAVLIVSVSTMHYVYGIVSSFISVLSFNFFFTEPLYTFQINQPDYIFTFFILLLASLISSTLTSKLIKSNKTAENRLLQIELIGEINKLISFNGLYESIDKIAEILSSFFGSRISIVFSMNDKRYYSYKIPCKKEEVYLNSTHEIRSEHKGFFETLIELLAQHIDHQELEFQQMEASIELREQKLKNQLLGAISHDLRTPLAVILGSSQILLSGEDKLMGKDRESLLKNIHEETRWLIDSVQNILSFVQVDEHLILNLKTESIEELFTNVVYHFSNQNNRLIILDIPDEDIFFDMDVVLMEKVLINLINNAVKYSEDDSKIILRAIEKEDRVIFEVEDFGYGIPIQKQKEIFERFVTLSGSDHKRKGLGLGLAIVKAIVEAHHGSINVRDNYPNGSIFRCIFPKKVNR